MGLTTFSGPVRSNGGFIGPSLNGDFNFTGNYYFVNPLTGSNGYTGTTPAQAFQTLAYALSVCTEGNNDVVYLISEVEDGVTTSATLTSNLNWNKDSTHLIGICAPTLIGQRARIAASGTSFTPLMTVSANNCYIANLSIWGGFASGGASNITLSVTGDRNAFANVSVQGIADATAAGGTGARVMKLTGAGENTFAGCTFGIDTIARTAANYTIEFAGGSVRNVFESCLFPSFATGSGANGAVIYAAASGGVDRFQLFNNCIFINAVQSSGTAITDLVSLPAAAGGMIVLNNCTTVGFTGLGTANAVGQTYIDMSAPSNSAGGLAVTPSA